MQVVKTSQDLISLFFQKFHRQNNKHSLRQADIPTCFLLPIAWFISFRAVPKTAPKPPNSSSSVLKTSSHKRRP